MRGLTGLPPIRLLVLDGDHTLWQLPDITCCSERYPDDPEGGATFAFRADPADPDTIIREDGVRLHLLPGTRAALEAIHDAGIRLAMASYNHFDPIWASLEAFGLLPLFTQVVATWSDNKEAMLRQILTAEAAAGRPTPPEAVLFVDDDPYAIYRPMSARVGVHFAQMGNPAEVTSFADIAWLLGVPT